MPKFDTSKMRHVEARTSTPPAPTPRLEPGESDLVHWGAVWHNINIVVHGMQWLIPINVAALWYFRPSAKDLIFGGQPQTLTNLEALIITPFALVSMGMYFLMPLRLNIQAEGQPSCSLVVPRLLPRSKRPALAKSVRVQPGEGKVFLVNLDGLALVQIRPLPKEGKKPGQHIFGFRWDVAFHPSLDPADLVDYLRYFLYQLVRPTWVGQRD